MRLQVTHRTSYTYGAPVTDSYNELRIHPISDDPQRVLVFELAVLPEVKFRTYRDFYLNFVHFFEIHENHTRLVIEGRSVLETQNPFAMAGSLGGVSFAGLAPCASREDCWDFLGASKYVALTPELWRLALDLRAESNDVLDTVETIMRWIFREFTYATDATTVKTHMLDALAMRKGVCQDFAHVMLGLCRSLGIPTRYVSGYLFDGGNHALRGDHASHAWCEIYLPELGWFGFDPTNNQLADDRYIKVAVGRDYDDVAPIKGGISGGGKNPAKLEVAVRVERLDPPPPTQA